MAFTFKHGDRPLDDYTVQRAVGSGGFGEVYYAISDGGREVALKFLRDNPQVELRGVSHCINLKSPNLIAIFDVKKNAQDQYFLIMEYCSGPSLRDLLIAEPNGFGPQKAAFFVREIAKGLAYLHDRGIVHRDLKPGNIFYDDGYVKIGDYGLSKFISVSRHSVQTSSVGTVHYMAPEIGSGNYSRGVDIYALGVMLYEMLLGRVPFEGSTMGEVLMKHLTAQPAVDELPHPFAHVIRRALQKDPRDRYQNVNEMVDDLLSVETVQRSLDGFSIKSLEGAVHGPVPSPSDAPRPSPNPQMPGAPFGPPPLPPRIIRPHPVESPSSLPLPDRLAKRLNAISRKVERKMAKLGSRSAHRNKQIFGVGGAVVRGQIVNVAGWRPWKATGWSDDPVARGRAKRMLLAGILTLGLAIALGFAVAGLLRSEEAGASAGMLVVAMWGCVLLARKAITWFGVENGPAWTQRLVRLLCAAPFLGIAAAPVLDRHGDNAIGLFVGLTVVAALTRWERAFECGSIGEMRIGPALLSAFYGFLATALVTAPTDGDPNFIFVGAAVAAAVSIALQATSWWLAGAAPAPAGGSGTADQAAEERKERAEGLEAPRPHPKGPRPWERDERAPDSAAAPRPSSGVGLPAMTERGPRMRWGLTRAFWGLAGFVFMGGVIVTFLIPLVLNDLSRRDVLNSVTACVALAAATGFAVRKTTAYRRDGFWRETLRPLLISLSFFGIGATITNISGGRHADWEEIKVAKADRFRRVAESMVFPGFAPKPSEVPEPPHECDDLAVEEDEESGFRFAMTEMRRPDRKVIHLLSSLDRGPWARARFSDEGLALSIAALVLFSMMFLTLLVFTGRGRRPKPGFIYSAGPEVDPSPVPPTPPPLAGVAGAAPANDQP
jgi:serine/threonine protein kinase